MKRYEQVPHTADIAARIYGKDLPELFENAAFAMMDMMADLEGLSATEKVEVQAGGDSAEELLISWLNEVLYISSTGHILFTEFNIKSFGENELKAEAKGEKVKEGPERIKNEIKAATYHDLEIKKTENGYEITVVFDI
jgi:SHS2 domain-containing protein